MTDKPSKLYYTISEVAELTGVKPHVLRYWEGEFPTLRPGKTRSGSRRYKQRDIDEILAIKRLLYEEGYRITGARKMRRQAATGQQGEAARPPQLAMPFAEMEPSAQLEHVRSEVAAILRDLQELGALALPVETEPPAGRKQAEGRA